MNIKKYLFFALSILFLGFKTNAQTGCPGCVIMLPDLPADTVFIGEAPDGQVGQYYDEDISFRMPQTTTPVAATDPSVPPGIDIDKITIAAVTNVPPGLSWEPDNPEFDLPEQTDGCVKFCGTPLQPGLYLVSVVVTVEVLFITEETSFLLPIMINPSVSASEGFSMLNNSGCGEVTVSFENNISSNGQEGYSYNWDFGNGFNSTVENPQDITYDEPGTYEVAYEAIIDTFGFFLTDVIIEDVSCNDLLGNAPDLFVKVFDPEGEEIISTPTIQNTSTPLTVALNLFIGEGNYSLQVIDNDGGLDGGDDICGTVNFNQSLSGTLVDNEMTVTLNIFHPVDTVSSVDTVRVFEQPTPPMISGTVGGNFCIGESYQMMIDYPDGNQWYRDSMPVVDSIGSTFTASSSGDYWVVHTSDDGCSSTSEVVTFEFALLPELPAFENDNNLLFVVNPEELPENYALQWQLNGFDLIDATDLEYCVETSGTYALIVTDLETGCSKASFLLDVVYNPSFPGCITSVVEQFEEPFKTFPNPTSGVFQLEWETDELIEASFRVLTVYGAVLQTTEQQAFIGHQQLPFDLGNYPSGLYFLEWEIAGEKGLIKIVKERNQ